MWTEWRVRLQRPVGLTTTPTVTVVIPNYNYEGYLRQAIDSALDQPGVDVNVVVADNGSTDGSVDVARGVAASDPRVRVMTRPANIPYIENFNSGLAQANGDYVVVLCSDDLLTPGSLSRATALLEAHPDLAFVYGHCPSFDVAPPLLRATVRSWTLWSGKEWTSWVAWSGRNFIRHPEVVMRASVLRAAGGYDESRPAASDMILWLRAAALGGVGRINGPEQGLFRVHGDNQHLHLESGLVTDLRNRREVFDVALPTDASGARMRERARRALAHHAIRFADVALDASDPQQRDQARDLTDFAIETWPGIVDGRRWKTVHARLAGDARRHTASRGIRRVRTTVASRLKRYVGV